MVQCTIQTLVINRHQLINFVFSHIHFFYSRITKKLPKWSLYVIKLILKKPDKDDSPSYLKGCLSRSKTILILDIATKSYLCSYYTPKGPWVQSHLIKGGVENEGECNDNKKISRCVDKEIQISMLENEGECSGKKKRSRCTT